MERLLEIRAFDIIERLDPPRAQARTLTHEPMVKKSKADIVSPVLPLARTLTEDPQWKQSNTLTRACIFENPVMESPDPKRTYPRRDMEDPHCTKLTTDMEEPNRLIARTDRVDPTLA
jgi:hypothetical protein